MAQKFWNGSTFLFGLFIKKKKKTDKKKFHLEMESHENRTTVNGSAASVRFNSRIKNKG